MNITMKQIADKTGYGIGTVSRALNDVPGVKPSTKQEILDIAKDLGYIIDANAQALGKRKTKDIGLVLSAVFASPFYNDFYIKVISGIIERTNHYGYKVRLFWLDPKTGIPGIIADSKSFKLAGIIFTEMCFQVFHVAASEIRKLKIPTVVLTEKIEGDNLWSVILDDHKGGYDGAKYLIESGHRNIGVIRGVNEDIEKRYEGVLEAAKESGVKIRKSFIARGDGGEPSGYKAMKKILKNKDLPSAVFCLGDELAYGAVRAMHEKKLRCPDDVSIMGYDNMLVSSLFVPRITTMSRPVERMGSIAVDMLLDKEKHKDKRCVEVSAELVERDSCRKVNIQGRRN